MQFYNLRNSLHSFVALPLLATNLLGSPLALIQAPIAVVQTIDETGTQVLHEIDNHELEEKNMAENIDNYFRDRNMPLAGTGLAMVIEAKKNGLHPYLLPALAVRESTGGIYACKKASFNPFGYGSCKIGFTSYQQAIEVVARNLNPETSRYYKGKDLEAMLKTYNPPHIVKEYASQVMSIMDRMENYENHEA
jgi:hypothetical protein